ncbi:zinc ABC transporter substrate-binding protein [Cytophagaceae bacterium ABcell3]|nr:zinc ABC transporter substrate-binding protein [Cytophagaceae bacterium ABcell3]
MNQFIKLLLPAILFISIASCDSPDERRQITEEDAPAAAAPSPITILTTTNLIADAVRQVAGDVAEVSSLMGPGVDPHLYRATDRDRRRIMESDVVYYNGLHLEGRMSDILAKTGARKPVIAVAEKIDRTQIIYHDRVADPHVWFDVTLWKEVVSTISQDLQERFPIHAQRFINNEENYLGVLDTLDHWARTEIGSIPRQQRVMVTAHDAFNYFGRAYNIEVEGMQGLSTLSDLSLGEVTEIVRMLVEREIKAVFVESSVPQSTVEAVVVGARARGHDVQIGGELFSDALGEEGTPEGTYVGMVEHNVRTITEALK